MEHTIKANPEKEILRPNLITKYLISNVGLGPKFTNKTSNGDSLPDSPTHTRDQKNPPGDLRATHSGVLCENSTNQSSYNHTTVEKEPVVQNLMTTEPYIQD